MRIRNSRPPMPILPPAPENVPRSSRFRSRGPLIDDRFLIQERLSGSGSGSKTSNSSKTFQREDNVPRFPTTVILALPATCSRPERELPVKKRMYYRQKVEKKDEAKKEQASEKKDGVKVEKAAAMEVNMNASMVCDNEDSGEVKGCGKSKSMQCVLNCESFIPCLIIDGLKDQKKADELLQGVKQGEMEKRRRGRPPKKPKTPRGNPGQKKNIYVLD